MTRRRKLLWILATVAAVAIALVAILVEVVLPAWLRTTIERAGTEALGREVRIAGPLGLSLVPAPSVEAEGVTLANTSWGSEPSMVRVGRVKIAVALASLWAKPVRIKTLEIDDARIVLEAGEGDARNWRFEGKRPASSPRERETPPRPIVVVEHAAIRDVEIVYRSSRNKPPLRFGIERLEAKLDPASAMIDLDAAGHLDDAPWDVAGRLGTLENVYALHDVEHAVTGHAGQAKVTLAGRIRDPVALGDPNLAWAIEGPDIEAALAVIGLRSPLRGPFRLEGRLVPANGEVGLDLTADLAGVTAKASGRVGALLNPHAIDAQVEVSGPDATVVGTWTKIEGFPPEPFEVKGHVRREGPAIALDDASIRLGATSVAASGRIGQPPRCVGTRLAVTANGKELSDLSALTRLRLPKGGFSAHGTFLRTADGLAVEDVEVRARDMVVRGSGTIGEPPALETLNMAVDAEGRDLAALSGIARIDLPHEAFALRGRVARRGEAFDLIDVAGQVGSNAATVEGSLVPRRRLVGSDLRAAISGPDLGQVGALFGKSGLPKEPYEISGRVSFAPDGYDLEAVEARVGLIFAEVDGHLGGRPIEDGTALRGRIQGPDLAHLAAWGAPAGLPPDPFTASMGVRIENGVCGVEGLDARVRDDRLALEGTLGALPDLAMLDVRVDAAGPRVADLARFAPDASREVLTRLPADPYEASGRVRRGPAGFELNGVRIEVGDVQASLDGVLGSGDKLVGTAARFEARAPDASLANDLGGLTLPAGAVVIRGRIERPGDGTRLDAVTVAVGDARATISGIVGDPPDLEGTDLDVGVLGPNLAAVLGPITGVSPLPSDPFEVSARVAGDRRQLAATGLVARLGENDVRGNVSARLGEKPVIEADVAADHLDVGNLIEGFTGAAASAETSGPQSPASKEGGRLIPDQPLALGALRSADARLHLTAAKVVMPGLPLHDVDVEAELKDGALQVRRFEGTGANGGHATGSLTVEPVDTGYRLTASGRVAGGRIDLSKTGDDPAQAPSLDAEFEVAGEGSSLHAIAASSDGSALITLGPGRIPANVSDVLTSGVLRGLLDALNPFRKSSPYTMVDCAVLAAAVAQGKAAVEPIAARTDKLTVIGRGKVDFVTEALELEWRLKPRKGVGISASSIANPYIRLGGTLASPSLEAKPLDAVASTGAAVATAGVTILLRGFYDRITAERKVCEKALEEVRRREDAREAGTSPR